MPHVIGIHFVCRDGSRVVDLGNGVFETSAWVVSPEHAASVRFIALHQRKGDRSYRQGEVLDHHRVFVTDRKIKGRFSFRVKDDGKPVEWEGEGTGEKGYVWR